MCAVPLWTVSAQQSSKSAKVEELFRLMKSEEMMQASLAQMRSMQQAQVARLELPPEAKARQQETMEAINKVIADRLSWEKIKPRFVQLMADMYTDEELDGIAAFYRSPAGKAMVDKMPKYMMQTMAIVQEAMRGVEPEIRRITEEAKQKK